MKVGKVHHILSYVAAGVAVLSVILAFISRLSGPIVITPTSYIAVATVAILFAIYFLVEGAVYQAKKAG